MLGQSDFFTNGSGRSNLQLSDPAGDEAPTIKINGKPRRTTKKSKLVIKGSAHDDVGVTRATIKGKRARLNFAKTGWSARLPLKRGRNILIAQAFDASNKSSKTARITVIRR